MYPSDMVVAVPLQPKRQTTNLANIRFTLLMYCRNMRGQMGLHLERGFASRALKRS